MIGFGIKDWDYKLNDLNNGEHLMNFNLNYHFADF